MENNKITGVNKVLKRIGIFTIGIILVSIAIWVFQIRNKSQNSHKTNVTMMSIKGKLEEINELAVYEDSYSNVKSFTDRRKIFGIGLPLTKNEVEITYKGFIKVIYKLDEVNATIDDENKIIYIALPDANIENNLNPEDMFIVEDDNILNPIRTDDVIEYTKQIEESELKIAIEEGIYDIAENRIKRIIEATLSEFGYRIVFS